MLLQRWNPLEEVRRMDDTLNRLWRGYGAHSIGGQAPGTWIAPVDVVEECDNVVVRSSLPGVDPKDIEVTIEDGVLSFKGNTEKDDEVREGDYLVRERRVGSFRRSVRLPETIDTDKAESCYEHGVLSITFPKQEARKPKRLEIKVSKN